MFEHYFKQTCILLHLLKEHSSSPEVYILDEQFINVLIFWLLQVTDWLRG